MKYVITGSVGNVSKPVTQALVQAGHDVTVITSHPDKVQVIESLGAKAAVGSVEDAVFLSKAFAGADAAYLMIPPNWNPTNGWITFLRKIADNYSKAIATTGVGHAVLLSSVGAHLGKGGGPIDGLSYAEWKLSQLTSVHLKILRPSYFFGNLMSQIPMIKNMNIMGSNFGGGKEKLVLTDPSDIANLASRELLGLTFKGQTINYVASDERHASEVARVLGKAIGKPLLPWIEFKDEDTLNGMLQGGLHREVAEGYVEMGRGIREGAVQKDYWRCRPSLGKVKLEDFANGFAKAYHS